MRFVYSALAIVIAVVVVRGCGGDPSGGDLCPPGESYCAGVCINSATDPFNCGGCGAPCTVAEPYCEAGGCVASCSPGLATCGGGCVDLASDPDHCGDCFNDCGIAEACDNADCVPGACRGELCGDLCIDLTSDPRHCGGCDQPCPTTAPYCDLGQCVPTLCDPNELDCGNGCEDTTANVDQCGACGVQCNDDEYCNDSACQCRPGLVPDGNGNCIDPLSNPNACGNPPVPCDVGAGEACLNGVCSLDCGGLDRCNGACVDTSSHPLYCGACDNSCNNDELCVNDNCTTFTAVPPGTPEPCTQCGGSLCCTYPGDATLTICVSSDVCP